MKRVSLALLSALGMLYGKCGYLAPIPMGYSYGTKIIPKTTNSNGDATGVCAWGSVSLHEYNFVFLPVVAKNTAIGFDGNKVVLTGSSFDMGEVSSSNGNAYGLHSSENLSLTLGTNYGLFGKTPSKITSTMIQAQNNAYGMYATKNLDIVGSGEIVFEAITSKAGVANGLYAQNNLQLEKSNIYFKSITSGNSAVGMGGYDIYTEENTTITFDEISATNNAYGIKAYSFYVGNFSLNIGKITSSNATAIGIEMGNEMLHNYYVSSFNSSTSLRFGEISGVNAIGLYTSGNGLDGFDFREEKVFLKFDKITASSGDAIGFYNNKASSTLSLVGDVLDFGSISSIQGNAYGFYSTSRNIDIKLSDSTLSLSLQGKDTSAFKSEGKGSIDLEIHNSTINLNGNGGSIQDLNASGNNYIDLSGRSHNALSSRTSSRTLSIHSLGSHRIMFGSTLSFGLYHAPDKGIADSITIDNLGSYDGAVNLDIYYDEAKTTKASPYALLLKSSDTSLMINGISSSKQVGSSVRSEGIEDVKTLIHRYDQAGVSYYYLDTQEKQQHYFNPYAITPILSGIDTHIGSYFLSSNTLNKRFGELVAQRDNSGLWGKISFGGVDGKYGEVESVSFDVGGDYAKKKGSKTYFVGVSATLAPSLSTSPNIQRSNHFKAGIYGGMYSESGFFYFSQLQGDYFQTQLAETEFLTSANLNQWGLSFSNELGYKIGFSNEGGGFYLEPRAMVSIGALLPMSYEQVRKDIPSKLQGELKAIFALDSKIGGRAGYRFGGGWDLYAGAYYSYKGLYGKGMKIWGESLNGGMLESVISNEGMSSFSSVLFDFGSNVEIGEHSRVCFDIEFGFGELYHTVYKVNASYRFSF